MQRNRPDPPDVLRILLDAAEGHQNLDKLLAQYLSENPVGLNTVPSKLTVAELMDWSYQRVCKATSAVQHRASN